MNSLEVAWAAGFYDGEGCTLAVSTTGSLMAAVSQVNRDNLVRFQRAVGGVGNIQRPSTIGGRRPISRFVAYGPEAMAVVRALWPFLGTEKRDQALRAMLRYAERRVGNQDLTRLGRCQRGHVLLRVGSYRNKRRGLECRSCRRMRHQGPAKRAERPRAYEVGLTVCQWDPTEMGPSPAERGGEEYEPEQET